MPFATKQVETNAMSFAKTKLKTSTDDPGSWKISAPIYSLHVVTSHQQVSWTQPSFVLLFWSYKSHNTCSGQFLVRNIMDSCMRNATKLRSNQTENYDFYTSTGPSESELELKDKRFCGHLRKCNSWLESHWRDTIPRIADKILKAIEHPPAEDGVLIPQVRVHAFPSSNPFLCRTSSRWSPRTKQLPQRAIHPT